MSATAGGLAFSIATAEARFDVCFSVVVAAGVFLETGGETEAAAREVTAEARFDVCCSVVVAVGVSLVTCGELGAAARGVTVVAADEFFRTEGMFD